jgi:hypothetical protein
VIRARCGTLTVAVSPPNQPSIACNGV